MGKTILIVEAEKELALRMAAVLREEGHAPLISATAADAMRIVEGRRPDLLVVRAELPDQNGFSLCSTLKREKKHGFLPLILASSHTSPEALLEHGTSSPYAADAYLSIPFAMEALVQAVSNLAVQVEASPLQPPSLPASRPPALPKRELRDQLTQADKHFVDRAFGSISHRRRELVGEGEAPWERTVPREIVNTPEGRLQLLREEVRSREAQLARLAEIWEVRERQLTAEEDKRLELQVEMQGLRMRLEASNKKADDALLLASQRQREHGESVNHLLLERFAEEKELIEIVAAKERDIGLLRREVAKKDEEIDRLEERDKRVGELEELLFLARERILADGERMSVLEEELATSKADRDKTESALLSEIDSLKQQRMELARRLQDPGVPEEESTNSWDVRPSDAAKKESTNSWEVSEVLDGQREEATNEAEVDEALAKLQG